MPKPLRRATPVEALSKPARMMALAPLVRRGAVRLLQILQHGPFGMLSDWRPLVPMVILGEKNLVII